ncbi:MAG: hypothetical protein SO108_06570 [Bacilli bacterium]|nr:hypothetical protein [Bacilli bacterium]
MISYDEAYLLGLLYGKGSIIAVNNDEVELKFKVKFRRPSDMSVRADNIHTVNEERGMIESLKSKLSNDFTIIINLLKITWGINSSIDLPNSYSIDDWGMKEIVVTTEKIDCHHERLCKLLNTSKLSNDSLKKFPFHLEIESSKPVSLSFVQGVCDACSLVPNEASSSHGGEGEARIQLEPSQERWELPIGLCRVFQAGLNIPVNNINWGHPQIRHSWRNQNHQFRVSLKCIPSNVELYRLNYKREEYNNLYSRRVDGFDKTKNCPRSKRISQGETIYIHTSTDEDLNSELLDERIRGISVDVPQKKSVLICKLLGCTQCDNYFDVEIIDNDEN